MRTKALLRSAMAMLMGGIVVTGCIDDNYDLSDIDTTTELQVKDLVLPLDIDEIAMENIVQIEDTGMVKVINGEYVVLDSGTYKSDEIIIPSLLIPAPTVAPIKSHITLVENNTPTAVAIPQFPMRFDIGTQMSSFTYTQSNVTEYIVDMDMIGAEFDIMIDLVVEGLENNIKSWTLEDFKMQFPKGLTGESNIGTYNPETGLVEIGSLKVEGSTVRFKMSITEVDLKKAGAVFDHATHSFTFGDEIGIKSGFVTVGAEDVISVANIPSVADFNIIFTMGDINVNVFGGTVQYSIEGINIADIPITGIPDILSQNLTDISLVNPQVYICFSNPLGTNFGLYAQTGLTLTAKRRNQPDQSYSIDNEYFKLACEGCQGCQFCLSPTDPGTGNYWGKFVNAQHVPFTSLSNVLSGNGLPNAIGIKLNNPCVPAQKIGHFPLGANLGRMTGCYTIYAPLQLKDGSKIIYSSTEAGWWDEEVAKVTIKKLQVNASITNDLPVDIEITGYPIDVNGNQINDVVIEGLTVKSGSVDEPLEIKITGEIKDLDGITFVAKAKATPQQESLRPNEHIILKNIKVMISGNYITEL